MLCGAATQALQPVEHDPPGGGLTDSQRAGNLGRRGARQVAELYRPALASWQLRQAELQQRAPIIAPLFGYIGDLEILERHGHQARKSCVPTSSGQEVSENEPRERLGPIR